MAETPIGATLAGKFLVKRLIGKGGMGAVYEGTHIEIGKRVAIKLIEPEHARSEDIASRFRQEARAASRVESDHIVQVFDVGHDPKFGLYMVMEYLTGEDVSSRLDRDGRIDAKVAVDIAYQAARGLAKAHAAGVIHRDLKPANIFLATRDDGLLTVKLVDFGISKVIAAESETHDPKRPITRFGSAVGTPQYMSPEQAQGQAIDQRTDVWALGACLYEMLSGKQAYQQLDTYEQTIFAIVLKKPPALEDIAPWVPAELVSIVGKALEHDMELRISDCGTFAKMLFEAIPDARGNLPRKARQDAPSRILRPTDSAGENHPDAIVIPDGAPELPHAAGRVASMAETQPLAQAISADDIAALQARTKPAPRQSPPTVSGVSVQANALRAQALLEHEGSLYDDDRSPKQRRGRTVLAVLLVAVALGVGGLVLLKDRGKDTSTSGATGNASEPSALMAPSNPTGNAIVPTTGASASIAVTSTSTPTPTGAALASGSLASGSLASASGKPSSKVSAGKSNGNPEPSTAPSESASVAASATASATVDPSQFGGTGVSSAY